MWLLLGSAGVLMLGYAACYIAAVGLGHATLRRARRTPGGEPARDYTFVGMPFGDRYFDPWRAERYFRDDEFATLQDAALVRRARLVKRLLHAKNAMRPALLVVCVVLFVASRFVD